MQDDNQSPINFATFGLSELKPPFTRASFILLVQNKVHFIALGKGQALYIILLFSNALWFY